MKQWEYLDVSATFIEHEDVFVSRQLGTIKFMEDLNELGTAGWELVTIYDNRTAILKRERIKERTTSLFPEKDING